MSIGGTSQRHRHTRFSQLLCDYSKICSLTSFDPECLVASAESRRIRRFKISLMAKVAQSAPRSLLAAVSVRRLKRDYLGVKPCPNAATVLRQIDGRFEQCLPARSNKRHGTSTRDRERPKERQQIETVGGGQRHRRGCASRGGRADTNLTRARCRANGC